MSLRIRQTPSTKATTKTRLATRIRLASFIQLPEKAFFERIRDLENDPLFQKLAMRTGTDNAIIRCRRFPHARFASGALPLQEGMNRDTGNVDVESLLDSRKETVALIRKIGKQSFEEHFLYNDDSLSAKETGERCGLSENEVRAVVDLINELSIRAEFFHPSHIQFESRVTYRKVAAIEYGDQGAVIQFYSPRYCSGKYEIDYDRFAALARQGTLSREEKTLASRLFRELELVNARKTSLYRILYLIAEVQREFCISGDKKRLKSYSQKEMANALGIDESLVCRAISGRSIVTPQGAEYPLKSFFPSRKDIRKDLIGEIVESSGGRLTDENIRRLLRERFGIDVSRRTVNACRNRGPLHNRE